MSWIIYKYTSPKGKIYIGQTSRSQAERAKRNGEGYKGNTRFYKAIQKYGFESFKYEEIETDIKTQQLANEREIYWISHLNSMDFNVGYNMSPGGYLQSEDQKQKARKTFQEHRRYQNRFIVCYELMRIFPNPIIALEWFLSNGYVTNTKKNPIVRVLNKPNATCFGYHFCEVIHLFDFKPIEKEVTNNKKGHRRKIICVDTGVIFDSLTDCEKIMNIKVQHLSRACKNHTPTHSKYFSYLEDYDDAWEKYVHKQIAYNKKAIYCIELDKTWDSYEECANELGFASSRLTTVIKDQNPTKIYKTINGFHFCRVDEIQIANIIDKPTTRSDSRKVVCVETNEIFDSITKAETKNKCKNILKCCLDWKYTSHGYHWCFLEDLDSFNAKPQIERGKRNAKSVIRVEDSKEFPSVTAAAKYIGCNPSTLCGAIKDGLKCRGWHWKYKTTFNN